MLIIEPEPEASSVLQNPSIDDIKDRRVLIDNFSHLRRMKFPTLSHTHTFQVMQPKPGTSNVLYNPSIDDIKDKRVLKTLLVIQES